MIKQYQRFFNLILILIDVAVITFSLFLAWYIRFETDLLGFGSSQWGFYHYMTPLVLIIPMYILLYYNFNLYDPQRTRQDIGSEAFQIIKVNLVGVLVLATVLFVLELTDYSRYLLAMFAIFSIVFSILNVISCARPCITSGAGLQHQAHPGYWSRELAERFAQKVEDNTYLGYGSWDFSMIKMIQDTRSCIQR